MVADGWKFAYGEPHREDIPSYGDFTIVAFLYAVALYGFNSFPLNSGWLPMLSALFLLVIASQAVGIFMIGVLPTFRLGLSSACLFGMIAFSIVGFSFSGIGGWTLLCRHSPTCFLSGTIF